MYVILYKGVEGYSFDNKSVIKVKQNYYFKNKYCISK